MRYDYVRMLEGIEADLRQRIIPRLADENARKYAAIGRTILSGMVADRRTRTMLDHSFLSSLADLLDGEAHRVACSELVSRLKEISVLARDMFWDEVERRLGALLGDMWATGEEATQSLAREIMALEAHRRNGIAAAWDAQTEKAAAETIPGGKSPSKGDEIAAFQSFLREKFEEPELEIVGHEAIVGGYSKDTLILELARVRRLPRFVVIRKDRAVTAIATTVADEFTLVKKLHDAGVAVAQPLALGTEKHTGLAFMISERVNGRSVGDPWVVNEPSPELAISLARNLALLHNLPPSQFGDTIDGARVSIAEYMGAAVDQSAAAWEKMHRVSPIIEAGLSWARANLDNCDGTRSLVHRDVGCHNMLVAKDNSVAAILDWETVWIGHRARDLAYVKNMVTQCIGWDDFRQAYQGAGGQWPSDAAMHFYAVWGDLQAAIECTRSGHLFMTGATDDISFAYSGIYNTERFMQRLSGLLSQQSRN